MKDDTGSANAFLKEETENGENGSAFTDDSLVRLPHVSLSLDYKICAPCTILHTSWPMTPHGRVVCILHRDRARQPSSYRYTWIRDVSNFR